MDSAGYATGTIERRLAPTAGSVPEPDAVRRTVGGIELFCNAADANLGYYSLLTARLVRGRGASWPWQPTSEN